MTTNRFVVQSGYEDLNGRIFSMHWKNYGMVNIINVIFNPPATIVFWSNGDKTVVKCDETEEFDAEKGMAMAISKHALGNKGNYYNEFVKYAGKYTLNMLDEKNKECDEAAKGFKDKIKENTKNLYFDNVLEIVVEAVQWTGENDVEITEFLDPINALVMQRNPDYSIHIRTRDNYTLLGIAHERDYVIKIPINKNESDKSTTGKKLLLTYPSVVFDSRYKKIMKGVV